MADAAMREKVIHDSSPSTASPSSEEDEEELRTFDSVHVSLSFFQWIFWIVN